MKNIYRIVAIVAVPFAAVAQQVPSSAGITSAATGITADTFSTADVALIENRARVFKDRLSASGTQYFAVTDRDLAGKSPEQVAASLSPSAIGPGVRNVEVVVDLHRSVMVAADPAKDLNIGTVTLTPAAAMEATNIETTTYISAPNLRVVRK